MAVDEVLDTSCRRDMGLLRVLDQFEGGAEFIVQRVWIVPDYGQATTFGRTV